MKVFVSIKHLIEMIELRDKPDDESPYSWCMGYIIRAVLFSEMKVIIFINESAHLLFAFIFVVFTCLNVGWLNIEIVIKI